MAAPQAGAWLPLHLAACAILLYRAKPEAHGAVWKLSLAWLTALTASTFLINPIQGSAATMWVLAALPTMALCIDGKSLKYYLRGFGAVLLLFAVNLILQWLFDIRYSNGAIGKGYAWPLLSSNTAAAVLNAGLIPAFWLTLKNSRWLPVTAIFATALVLTQSNMGMLAAAGCCFLASCAAYGSRLFLAGLIAAPAAYALAVATKPELITLVTWPYQDRAPIWASAWLMIMEKPWAGWGLGTFGYYYQQIRTEAYTAGWYAHNDVIQIAVEMGIPCAALFSCLAPAVLLTTGRRNFVAALVMLAVLLQAMTEFPLYMPAVSILMGLALAFHIRNPAHGKKTEYR